METQFANVGDASVAYRILGEGPADILMFLGEYMPIDSPEDEPRYARCLRRLGSIGRVILFNRRGVGLSDPPDGPVTQEQAVEDAVAVLDHAGVERAVAFGSNVSGPSAMLFASAHPERTSALVLVNTWPRIISGPDFPFGFPRETMAQTGERTTSTQDSDFDFLSAFAPSVADDDLFRSWWDRAGHRGASPARSRALWNMLVDTDVRSALPDIAAPSIVIHRSGLGGTVPIARYTAETIPDALYVEVPGSDIMWWVGDSDVILDQIETFIGGRGSPARAQRKLATVLFLDVVGSTEALATVGDQRWREVLGTYHELSQREIERCAGTRISTSGDGIVATFELPADAVRVAKRISAAVGALSISVRAGVHTGEIEIVGDDVAGMAVHIAARVMSAAQPGEVLVSRTVTDLVTGSGLTFDERGEHDLKGVPGTWQLFAVRSLT